MLFIFLKLLTPDELHIYLLLLLFESNKVFFLVVKCFECVEIACFS